jgi:elongator complex protein 3
MFTGSHLEVGQSSRGAAQHSGSGTRLIEYAEQVTLQKGLNPKMAVIAAVGTRCYYIKRGFQRGELYLVKSLGEEKVTLDIQSQDMSPLRPVV